MSRQNETVLSHSGQLLHTYIKSFIVLDPKFIACRKVKIGDTVTGHVVFTNKKILSCRGIHVTLMGRSTFSSAMNLVTGYQSIGTDFLIQNGKTQNGIPMRPNAIPKGTHKFPFSLLIPNSDIMVPSFQFFNAELHFELQTIIVLKTGAIHKTCSMPVRISDYLNISATPEFSIPILHLIHGSISLFNSDSKNNIRIRVESPRSAYCSEEEMPITITFLESENFSKIKSLLLCLVQRDDCSFRCKHLCHDETVLISKSIKNFSKVSTETLILPPDLRQSFDFSYIGNVEGSKKIQELFRVTRSYFLKVTVQPTGFGSEVSDRISIVIGTDNVQTLHQRTTSATSLGTRCVWNGSDYGSQLSLLPAYSDLFLNKCDNYNTTRHRDSVTSIETLPPTFEEALKIEQMQMK